MENTVTITLDRYDELIRAEARLRFMVAYYKHESYMSSSDIKYYLGIKEDAHEDKVSEPSAE